MENMAVQQRWQTPMQFPSGIGLAPDKIEKFF